MNDNDALREAISEATASFDAGNHAWGRYLLYVLRRYRGDPPAPDPAAVRAALQDAVLSVPQQPDIEDIRTFYAAIQIALREVEQFVALLPDVIRTGDILLVPEAFIEAADRLEPWRAP